MNTSECKKTWIDKNIILWHSSLFYLSLSGMPSRYDSLGVAKTLQQWVHILFIFMKGLSTVNQCLSMIQGTQGSNINTQMYLWQPWQCIHWSHFFQERHLQHLRLLPMGRWPVEGQGHHFQRISAICLHKKKKSSQDTPLKTNMTLQEIMENHHFQLEIHLQMVDVPLSC